MKKVNLKNTNLIEISSLLSESRNNIFDEYQQCVIGMWLHSGEPVRLLDYIFKQDVSEEVIACAKKSFIINVVSVWETFFRDMFLIALKMDVKFKQFYIDNYVKNNESLDDSDVDDVLVKVANFQNINDINISFYNLFNKNILDVIGSESMDVAYSRYLYDGFKLDMYFSGWQEFVNDAFDKRHKYIHDTHYSHSYSKEEILKIGEIFLLVPQIFGVLIANKFVLKKTVFNDTDYSIKLGITGRNYFRSVDSILNSKYKIR